MNIKSDKEVICKLEKLNVFNFIFGENTYELFVSQYENFSEEDIKNFCQSCKNKKSCFLLSSKKSYYILFTGSYYIIGYHFSECDSFTNCFSIPYTSELLDILNKNLFLYKEEFE